MGAVCSREFHDESVLVRSLVWKGSLPSTTEVDISEAERARHEHIAIAVGCDGVAAVCSDSAKDLRPAVAARLGELRHVQVGVGTPDGGILRAQTTAKVDTSLEEACHQNVALSVNRHCICG